eukprot:3315841-Rhodomonas_salina.2
MRSPEFRWMLRPELRGARSRDVTRVLGRAGARRAGAAPGLRQGRRGQAGEVPSGGASERARAERAGGGGRRGGGPDLLAGPRLLPLPPRPLFPLPPPGLLPRAPPLNKP